MQSNLNTSKQISSVDNKPKSANLNQQPTNTQIKSKHISKQHFNTTNKTSSNKKQINKPKT